MKATAPLAPASAASTISQAWPLQLASSSSAQAIGCAQACQRCGPAAVSAEGTGRPRLPVGACIEARKGRMRDSTPVSTLNRPSSNSSTAVVGGSQASGSAGTAADQGAGASVKAATEQDWFEEYLAPVISVKVVSGVDEAIAHINHYGSHHTDAILTRDHMHAQQFLREVDSASVMVNASTRFADGFEFGLGAEIGISTDKFHARGPVGIEGLTSLKYVVLGDGEVRG